MKSAPPINDFNLSICWNKMIGEELGSSAMKMKKDAAVKGVMLIIYVDRHICAPSNSFALTPTQRLYTPPQPLQTSTLQCMVLCQNDE